MDGREENKADMRNRVLLIEDDKVDQMAFKRLVKEQDLPYDYTIAGSVSKAREALGLEKFDIVITDYLLGDGTAFDVFDFIINTPIIFITGAGDEEIAIKAMKAGAYDYLIKDPDRNYLKILSVTVENAIKRKKAEEIIKKQTAEVMIANKQLQIEITERKKMENRIKASLEEKEVLLKEIHHRVKNNMQVIYGLLNVQCDYIRNKQCIDILRGCQNQIMSMALVHKILYRSKDLTHIDLQDYISRLANKLLQSYGINNGKVTFKINAENVPLGVNTTIPCGLIINELVSNSLKHAFPGKKEGKIQITLCSIDKNLFELVINDNGIGIPEDIDIKNTETLGIKMVVVFVEDMLQGTIELIRDKGTEFRIKFKG